MLRRAWGFLKLAYLYGQYWIVGLDEGGFQIVKGNYLLELEYFPAAARAFQRALRETQSPRVHASLGYAYLSAGMPDRAVEALKLAYAKLRSADVGIMLAYAHHENGDAAESARLCESLQQGAQQYTPTMQADLQRLQDRLKSETPNNALQLTSGAAKIDAARS